MIHILSEIFLFLQSVFTHLQVWLSGSGVGGFVVIAVGVVDHVFNKKMSKRTYVNLFLITFFLCSCFLSWVDKNDALQASVTEHADDKQHYIEELQRAHDSYGQLQAQCQYKSGVLDTLTKQNRDEQEMIDHCQEDAIKRITPSPLSFRGSPLHLLKGEKIAAILISVDRTLSPANLSAKCSGKIEHPKVSILGGNYYSGTQPSSESSNEWQFEVVQPAWSPLSPILFEFSYTQDTEPSCDFNASVPR